MAIVVNSDASAFKRTANLPSATAYSLHGWFMLTTDRNTFSGLIGITDGTNYHQLCTDSDGTTLNLFRGNPGAQTSLLALSLNTWYFAAMTCAGTGATDLKGYIRSITDNTLTSVSATGISFTPSSVEWGRDGFSGEYMTGRIHAFGMENAALSADELLELSYYHEPQLDGIRSLNVFYPTIESVNTNCTVDRSGNGRNATATVGALADSPPLLWRSIGPQIVLPGASAGAYTLTADSGSFTLTGTAAGLRAARTIGAASGSFTLTGTAASLEVGYEVAAASGSFALTGTAVTLTATRKLTADSGSFTLTGTDATLTYGATDAVLTADSGTFTLNGTAASLLTARKLTAASGSFALTGTAATLTFGGYRLTAGSGSFALTGQDATLTTTAAPAVTEQPSGGYGFFNEYELYRQRRAHRKARERREQEEADEIQADLDRQIAKLLREQEAKDAERADFARLQRIADDYAGTRQPVPRPIAATLLKAYEERTRNALEQLEREMNRMFEEEEMTVLQLLLNGDL